MIDDLSNAYTKLCKKYLNNRIALAELNRLIFDVHREAFESLSNEDQWVVREFIHTLRLIYG